ncbi:MAG: penicillin-binding protein 2 [Verrucomicrobiota bacterium]
MNSGSLRLRALGVICCFACVFTVISSRLVYLQLVSHEHYHEKSIEQHYENLPVPPQRGRIIDRHGRVFAQTLRLTDLHIDGKLALESPELLPQVADILEIPLMDLQGKLSPKRRWELIQSDLTEPTVEKLRLLKSKGARYLIFEDRLQRIYPNGAEGSHVVGFTNMVDKVFPGHDKTSKMEAGMQGVERIMDKYLAGTPGKQRVALDAGRREIAAYRQVDLKPLDGLNVVITLDQTIQHVLEKEADRIIEEFSPDSLSIVAVKPTTGEILGLTNRPTFNPNDTKTRRNERLRNSAITDEYEPGSTFKIVTLSAALSERVAELETPVFCENGEFVYAGETLSDYKPFGMLDVKSAFAMSSNIAFAKLALQLRQDRLYRYGRHLGYGEQVQAPNMSFNGEPSGKLKPPQYWSRISITRIPIGYEIATTNLQMSMAVAAIANGGKLMQPQFIKSVENEDGGQAKIYMPKMVRQAVRPEVCDAVTAAMVDVVEYGTGTKAAVPGVRVAGKTGTARKFINGQYVEGAYSSSFIGFFPAENPEVLISVVVGYPKGGEYGGGVVAAPSFGRMARKIAQHLDVVTEPASIMTARRPE